MSPALRLSTHDFFDNGALTPCAVCLQIHLQRGGSATCVPNGKLQAGRLPNLSASAGSMLTPPSLCRRLTSWMRHAVASVPRTGAHC